MNSKAADERQAAPLAETEWDFDAVPNDELVACCYWEYARESVFIRDVRRRCLDPKLEAMVNSEHWEFCGHDIEKIKSIGYESEVFVRGFFCPPDGVLDDAPPLKPGETRRLTGAFPKAWQELTQPERHYRKHIGNDVERIPLVPFQRGISLYAQAILDRVKSQRDKAAAERDEVRRMNPKLNEEILLFSGKLNFPDISPSVFWEGGQEVTVVELNWGEFTNEEMVQYFRRWVKENRPKQFENPDSRGHKLKDWRAQLTRLGVLRLLSRFSALQLVKDNRFPEIWKTKQLSGRKWGDV